MCLTANLAWISYATVRQVFQVIKQAPTFTKDWLKPT